MKQFLLIIFLFSSSFVYSQIPNYLLFDKYKSQSFGAENGITLHKFFYTKSDEFIPLKFNEENTFLKKSSGMGYRFLKLALLDLQVDWMFMLTQHEVFGHGSRYREFGFTNNSYNLNLLPPFGSGGGFAVSGILKPNKLVTESEFSAILFSGNESNVLFSDKIASRLVLQKDIHYRKALLYLMTKNNLIFYIWSDKLFDANKTIDGDVERYVDLLYGLYSDNKRRGDNLNRISKQSLISLLNPFQWYSAYVLTKDYLIDGNTNGKKMPSIHFSKFNYLPALGYNLTPFGSEFIFTNYFFTNEQSLQLNVNYGDQTYFDFYSGGIKAFNLFPSPKLYFGVDLQVWSQPELQLEDQTKMVNKAQIGGLLKVDLSYYPFQNQNYFGAFVQLGYKTKGYSLGEKLEEGLILQFGISLRPE